MDIQIDNLEGLEIGKLLEEHHQDMLKHSPPESVHALDLSALREANITFWSARINGQLAGCGALKELSKTHVELKSMRTSRQHLRKGVAATILTHLLAEAKARAYKKISLETGSMDVFIPAQQLYKKFGFLDCEPFSNYQADPYSRYLSKNIE